MSGRGDGVGVAPHAIDATAPPHAIVASNVIYARLANRAEELVLGTVAALEVRA